MFFVNDLNKNYPIKIINLTLIKWKTLVTLYLKIRTFFLIIFEVFYYKSCYFQTCTKNLFFYLFYFFYFYFLFFFLWGGGIYPVYLKWYIKQGLFATKRRKNSLTLFSPALIIWLPNKTNQTTAIQTKSQY